VRSIARRRFLQNGLGISGALLLGACSGSSSKPSPSSGAPDNPTPSDCPDQFAGGQQLGVAPFVGESERPLEQAFDSGLDGRLYTDLSKLGPTNLVTPSEAFYIRTRYPDLLVRESPWRISLLGVPGSSVDLFLDDLLPMAVDQGPQLMECSGNTRSASFGLLSSAEWAGVRLLDAMARRGSWSLASINTLNPRNALRRAPAGYSVSTSSSAPAHFWRPS